MRTVDIIIIGGGLAGCALAWQCRRRGRSAVIIDAPRPDTSSRAAAGLVTPITGSRFAISWRWHEFFPAADTLYQIAEQETGRSFWSVAPAWRCFLSEQESRFCRERWLADGNSSQDPGSALHTSGVCVEPLSPSWWREMQHGWGGLEPRGEFGPWGGIRMAPAARLDVPAYLEATRGVWERAGWFHSLELDIDRELVVSPTGIEIPCLGESARWVVMCQGYRARTNAWFGDLPLHPARGDILRVRSSRVRWDHVLHGSGWIVPLGSGQFLVGASYDRHALETSMDHPAARRWRQELSHRWHDMTGEAIGPDGAEILEQRIAVRPASYDRHPLIGRHRQWPQVLCLNGLGSKGSLMAPWLAQHMLDAMLDEAPIDPTLEWTRRGRREA